MSWRNNLISLIIRPLNSVKDLFSRSNPSGYEILKSKSLDYSSGVSELPSVLILEILLKLPIQIILRCRCVCKTWNNLISEKYFAKNTSIVAYGFGFSDHYKVLRIVRRDHSGNECDIHGEIFTIGVDRKWRSFDDSSLAYMLSPCGIFLDGILYFVGYLTSGFLLAFDMEEERGRRITLPTELEGTPSNNIVLAVCNDNLCLSDKTDPHQLNIWTMKRDGVVESWSKEIILKLWISHGLLYLITTLKNGDLLMNWYPMVGYSDGLLSYNRKTKKCSKLQYTGISFPWEYLFLSPIVLCRAEP
ncbi:hypothetical protein ACJIZ3_008787 [Penstemon smallii]|uniref:F-box domain-containing protein n=1 Tax=Penstemon smallii TaxID=265156 RepID=A0ABD3TAQ8_9LAMI